MPTVGELRAALEQFPADADVRGWWESHSEAIEHLCLVEGKVYVVCHWADSPIGVARALEKPLGRAVDFAPQDGAERRREGSSK